MEDETFSTHGAICPFCGHLNRASDSDGLLYDESLYEWECAECGETFALTAFVQWSWTAAQERQP